MANPKRTNNRAALCDEVCAQAAIKRDKPGAHTFTLRELILLESWVSLQAQRKSEAPDGSK